MKALRSTMLVAAVLVLASAGVALGGGPLEDYNYRLPLDEEVWVPCANGGAGEVVHLTGEMHILLQCTVDANGGLHIAGNMHRTGVRGIGLTTGSRYNATGGIHDHTTSLDGGAPYIFTYAESFQMVGQSRNGNYRVHHVYHITTDANGEFHAQFDHASAECD